MLTPNVVTSVQSGGNGTPPPAPGTNPTPGSGLTPSLVASLKTPGSAGGVPASKPMNDDSFNSWLGSVTGKPATPAAPAGTNIDEATGKPGLTPVDLPGYFKNVFNDYSNAKDTAVQDTQEAAQDFENGGVGNDLKGVEKSTIGQTSNAVGAIFAPFTEGVKSLSDAIVKNVSNNPTLQKIASTKGVGAVIDAINGVEGSFDSFAQEHPSIASSISDAVNTGMGAVGGEVAPEGDVVQPTIDAATATKNAAVDTATNAKNAVVNAPSAASEAINTFKQGQVENAKSTSVKEWNAEVKNQEGKTQNLVTNAAAKGNDIPQTLAERGITSHSLIGENGKFDTGTKVSQLKGEADDLYNTTIKPLVDRATQMGVTMKLPDIMNRALIYLKSAKAPTNVISDVIGRIRSEFANNSEGSLQNKFSEKGMSPAAAETEKHAHWNEINWSKVGGKPTGENLYNSAMGHAYQSAIEDNLGVPKETVKSMNAGIGKIRDTGNFLQRIDGDNPAMKPQKGTAGRIIQKGLQVGGGALGEMLGGHFGAVGGYFLTRDVAANITKFLTSLPADVRDYWMKDLQAKAPEAASQIQDYLTKQANFKPAGLLENKNEPIMEKGKDGIVRMRQPTIQMPSDYEFNRESNAAKSGVTEPEKPGGLYEYFKNQEASQKAIGNVKKTPGRPAKITVDKSNAKTSF